MPHMGKILIFQLCFSICLQSILYVIYVDYRRELTLLNSSIHFLLLSMVTVEKNMIQTVVLYFFIAKYNFSKKW